MLDPKQRRAVALLFQSTDEEVIRKLKINRQLLDEWKRDPQFAQALCDFVRDNRLTAIRFISKRVVEAAQELEAMIKTADEKVRHKVIIDLLKASGLLAAEHSAGEDETDGFMAVLNRITEAPDDTREED